MVRVSFFGACRTVTGSKYLVESERARFLVDCGLFQGRKELRERNWTEPPFAIDKLDGIILTHAHIDHTGYLPLLVKRGYRKPIFCTAATKELAELLLEDTARLQEEEASYANEVGSSRHHPAEPLYSVQDARETMTLLRVIPRGEWSEPLPGVRVKPLCAGHILGACTLSFEIEKKRLTFSGDIGRYGAPILPDPVPVEIGDLLVCESTYGNKDHPKEDVEQIFLDFMKRAIARQGPIIIPAFALGRTQTLLYFLRQLETQGKIPELPVFIDSPMAIDATEIYRRFNYDFDEAAAEMIRLKHDPLSTARMKYVRTVKESKALNDLKGSRVIIAGSGMVNGGRVLHHLLRYLPAEDTTVLFVGYQGEETRGARIQRGEKEVKIFGRYVPIRAHVESVSGLSAHGDRGELMRWLTSSKGTPSQVRIVHGEPVAAEAFATLVQKQLGWKAALGTYGEVLEV